MATADIDVGTNGKYLIRFPYRVDVLEAIKTIPSRKWLSDIRAHEINAHDVEATINALRSIECHVLISPIAEKAITQYITEKKNLIILKNKPVDQSTLPVTKLPLYPFQATGYNYLINAKQCLLADDMGIGKTAQIIVTFKALKEQGKADKMMVLCPSSVKGSWAKDISKFTDFTAVIIEGTPKQRRILYSQPYDIIIIGYETYLSDFGGTRDADSIPLPDARILILDECQRLVRFRNKTTQAVLILKDKLHLDYIYLLTGTPIVNKIEDLWSLLCFVDMELVGEFWQFRNRYCVVEYQEIKMLDQAKRKLGIFERITRKIPKVIGYKNLDELKSRIEPYYIRREKKDVLKDLPDKIYETYEIKLTQKQRELYDFVRDDFANAFRDIDVSPANALVYFIRAKQICDSAELIDTENQESAKLNELRALLEDLMPRDDAGKYLPSAHSVILFSQYREMTDILVREFKDYLPLYLHGQVVSQDRQVLIDEFQNNSEKHKLFISTLRAGGVGITLTAADVVIQFDKWFSPAANNQAIDRCIDEDQLLFVHGKGLITIQTVASGDMVLSGDGKFHKVLKTKKRNYSGLMTEIQYKRYASLPLKTTYDHKIFIIRNNLYQWIEAHAILPGDYLVMPKYSDVRDCDAIPIHHYAKRYFYNQCGNKQRSRAPKLPDNLLLDNMMLYIMGFYLANGWASVAKGKSAIIGLADHKRDINNLQKIKEYFKSTYNLNGTIYTDKNSNSISLSIYSTDMAYLFLNLFGHMAYNKSIPDCIMQLPSIKLKHFLHGYLQGDGYKRNNQQEWISISSQLSYQILLIAGKLGMNPTLRLVKQSKSVHMQYIGSYTIKDKKESDKYSHNMVRSVMTNFIKRRNVYDLTIEGEHNFVVGLALVHNCHRIGQKNIVTVINFICKDTIEERIEEILERKRNMFEGIFGEDEGILTKLTPQELRGLL